jgi:UDP:flavonoid glycosyltransferase YjiC (YdhE family)
MFPNLNQTDGCAGAGTTAIGLKNGLPTIVVPFFGDQQ